MKKNKAAKKPKVSIKEQVKHLVGSVQTKLAGHGVFIIVVIAGGAIGLSLMRSRNYLNPVRDEAHYQEASAGANISTIDLKLVNKLQDALNDTDVTVSPELAPNRSNPFSE